MHFVCAFSLVVQLVAGFFVWKTSRVTQTEADMALQRQTLRAGVAKVSPGSGWPHATMVAQSTRTYTYTYSSSSKILPKYLAYLRTAVYSSSISTSEQYAF